MTNAEVIRTLTRLKDQINFEWTDAQKKMDALNVAIKALSEQPETAQRTSESIQNVSDSDSISRKKTIEAIEGYFGDLPIVVHHDMVQLVSEQPAAEITYADVVQYCNDRHLFVITAEYFYELTQTGRL